jgi:hypothetical protein
MELIWEGFGPAQHKEALRQVACLIRSGTWERLVAADNLRKAEKTAARERATARATVLESERAATIASLADIQYSEPYWAVVTHEPHGEPRACAV